MSVLCITGIAPVTAQAVNAISDCVTLGGYLVQPAITVATQPTLQYIFSIPIASDLNQMFQLGVGLPILCWLTSWAYGSLINFFHPNNDQKN
ncbi:MAG: hypothetical protein WCK96_19075 [Methylococcales bacterium]